MTPITKHERRQQIDHGAAAAYRRRRDIDQLLADRRLEREHREVWDERPFRCA